jgi:thiol:disulfide interchange protein
MMARMGGLLEKDGIGTCRVAWEYGRLNHRISPGYPESWNDSPDQAIQLVMRPGRLFRSPSMKSLIALLLVAAPMLAQGPIKWEHTYQAALKRAKAEKKLIFMDLWTEWCGPCQYLQKNIFPSAEGQAALAKVVPFSALVEKKDRTPVAEGTSLAQTFRLNAYPTMVILDAEGKEVRRQVGAFRTGAEFAAWLGSK